jgi:UPF0716 protein FxsA
VAAVTERRGRRRWPRWLVAALVVLPVLEVVVLVLVARWIGVLPTLLVLLVGALVGAALLVREVPRSWRGLRGSLGLGPAVVVDGTRVVPQRGRAGGAPQVGREVGRQVVDGSLVLVGAVLIVLPGLLSDLAGIACLLPLTRALPRRLLLDLVERRAVRFAAQVVPGGGNPAARGALRGEVVDPPADRFRKQP